MKAFILAGVFGIGLLAALGDVSSANAQSQGTQMAQTSVSIRTGSDRSEMRVRPSRDREMHRRSFARERIVVRHDRGLHRGWRDGRSFEGRRRGVVSRTVIRRSDGTTIRRTVRRGGE
jgi:hypothetical protein